NDERGPRREGGFGGGDRPRFNRDERGPRPERSFGDRPRREEGGFGRSDRPRFNDERGPRREGGFGGGDRPRFNRDERAPRPERSFGDRPRREEGSFGSSERPSFRKDGERPARREGDRPRMNRDERGPRPERSFGDRKPAFNKGPRKDGGDRAGRGEPQFERSFVPREGEERRSFSGIRTYRAPAALKGKSAPVKVIRGEDDDKR
ncbi:MAG: hypothetical protein ACI4QS_05985, partial [Comamonas sp.]